MMKIKTIALPMNQVKKKNNYKTQILTALQTTMLINDLHSLMLIDHQFTTKQTHKVQTCLVLMCHLSEQLVKGGAQKRK